MKPIPLTTERLILRRATELDASNLFRNYCGDPESARFLTRAPHAHISETLHFLNKWCDSAWGREEDQFAWVVSLAEKEEAIGVFLVMAEGHKVQIHYGIGRSFWGKGYATEAGYAAIEWLKSQPDLQKIWAVSDLLNVSSMKVLEKLGFEKEGLLKKWLVLPAFGDIARDCQMYTYTWDANK